MLKNFENWLLEQKYPRHRLPLTNLCKFSRGLKRIHNVL